MNYARLFTLLSLVIVVVAFAATWLTVPVGICDTVPPPARFFMSGLTSGQPSGAVYLGCESTDEVVDLDALKERIVVVYASAAVVVALLGLALGAVRRPRATDG